VNPVELFRKVLDQVLQALLPVGDEFAWVVLQRIDDVREPLGDLVKGVKEELPEVAHLLDLVHGVVPPVEHQFETLHTQHVLPQDLLQLSLRLVIHTQVDHGHHQLLQELGDLGRHHV